MAAASAAAAAAVCYSSSNNSRPQNNPPVPSYHSVALPFAQPVAFQSRYESQKRKDWITFLEYLRNRSPPLTVSLCGEAHVVEFLKYLDQFGDTKVHVQTCKFYGRLHAPSSCECRCPIRQASGSVEAIVGRLRVAFQENDGHWESNPFGSRAVRLYLVELRDAQDKSRGVVC